MKTLMPGLFGKKTIEFKRKEFVYDLIIYDDLFPHPASGFRLEEFTVLLNNINNSKTILSDAMYKHYKLPGELRQLHIDTLLKRNTALNGKIENLQGSINVNCRLFYCIFLNNIYKNLDWIEKFRIPFAFTLYPGGGFLLDDAEVDKKLKKILSSRYFRKVIVTQKKTYNYLLEAGFCKENDILFVFGVVVPQGNWLNNDVIKKYYRSSKESFDVCFCAAKYTKYGEDKGYPLFVDFMKEIAPKYKFVRFHIIGGFDKNVIDVEQIEDRITFYGYQDYNDLKKTYKSIDLIISPNQPDKGGKGSFDGFPLGTVVEAALNEVVVMLTDSLKENRDFEDGRELIIIQPNVTDMVNKFEKLIGDVETFYEIAKNGRKKFQYIYSNDYQVVPRLNLLKSLIDENAGEK